MSEEIVRATVERIIYRSPGGDWSVTRMIGTEGKNRAKSFCAVGPIPYCEQEEVIEMIGSWHSDKKYGQQFKAGHAYKLLPATVAGIKGYLANAKNIKGIGPSRADKLVKHFGIEILEILNTTPDRLSECPGISPDLALRIGAAWGEDSIERRIGMFLEQHGISCRWVDRILETFPHQKAIDIIKQNPYKLTKVDGIGFLSADVMAKSLGFPESSPERAEAACVYCVSVNESKGHVFTHEGQLILELVKLLNPKAKSSEELAKAEVEATEALKKVVERGELISEKMKDDIMELTMIYRPHLHNAEVQLATRIRELNNYSHEIPERLDTVLHDVQEKMDLPFSPKQREAIRNVFSNHVLIITGGPGTGKTTCVRAITECAEKLGQLAVLVAPTGRAAKRLSEVTGRTTSTIHKALGWGHNGPSYGPGVPISADVLIVDEASMVDLDLAHALFSAVPDSCSVVLIGDTDQLPAIGPGSVLRDLIRSKQVKTTVLDTIFRQAEDSTIIRNAHLIRQGEKPRFDAKGDKENSHVFWIPTKKNEDDETIEDVEWAREKLIRLVGSNIPERIKVNDKPVDPIRDVQVLVPMKKLSLGVHELNPLLQQTLNPNGKVFTINGREFRIGDRVIQLRNNYEPGMEISNGDIGFIKANDPEEKFITIDFYGRDVEYPHAGIQELQLAYAQTVHKAQGSEYPVVVIVMGKQHWPMLERNLLYTANTRAKNLCLFIASHGAIEHAVKNNPVKERNTYLAQRLRSGEIE